MTTLALESPDNETKEMLLAIQNFLLQETGDDRWVIEFDFSNTVSCCNISFNAQQLGIDGGYYDPVEVLVLSSYQKLVIGQTLQLMKEFARKQCNRCGEIMAGEHTCKESKELAQAAE